MNDHARTPTGRWLHIIAPHKGRRMMGDAEFPISYCGIVLMVAGGEAAWVGKYLCQRCETGLNVYLYSLGKENLP